MIKAPHEIVILIQTGTSHIFLSLGGGVPKITIT